MQKLMICAEQKPEPHARRAQHKTKGNRKQTGKQKSRTPKTIRAKKWMVRITFLPCDFFTSQQSTYSPRQVDAYLERERRQAKREFPPRSRYTPAADHRNDHDRRRVQSDVEVQHESQQRKSSHNSLQQFGVQIQANDN